MTDRRDAARRRAGWILALAVLTLGLSPQAGQLRRLPEALYLTEGHTTNLTLASPLGARVADEGGDVLSSSDERLGDATRVSLTGGGEGKTRLDLTLMGLKVRSVDVSVARRRMIVPCGQSVGVAIQMDGVLIVGASDIGTQPSPARRAGLRAGDRVVEVDGERIESAAQLSALLDAEPATLTVGRQDQTLSVSVTPVRDARDGSYRLGAWVRDSTAGVGTLTFYDPASLVYGALGHAITDADTGSTLAVGEGGVYESRVLSVRPGERGEPGELLGEFFEANALLGDVKKNIDFGIYGRLEAALEDAAAAVPVLSRDEVRLGAAELLCTLPGEAVDAYDCEIVRLNRQAYPAQRGLVVRVTDERLIGKTGGIVQGMSGSPILQDGCFAGAITHVYVSDPTVGYGVYAEWMLDAALAD